MQKKTATTKIGEELRNGNDEKKNDHWIQQQKAMAKNRQHITYTRAHVCVNGRWICAKEKPTRRKHKEKTASRNEPDVCSKYNRN